MIDEIIDQLPPAQSKQLYIAFNELTATFIEYEAGKFIGVHTDSIPFLHTLVREGCWTLGLIHESHYKRTSNESNSLALGTVED
jgi:hypothetical protein